MTKADQQLQSKAERLRRQLAEAEATAGQLKTAIAKIESKLTGGPAPETGLELLWKAARPIARTRSSKIQCRTEFTRIPAHDRPSIRTMLDALTIWNRCAEWKKDGGAYIPGLHRWIRARQWENLPEENRPRPTIQAYTPAAPIASTSSDDAVTAADIADAIANVFPQYKQRTQPESAPD